MNILHRRLMVHCPLIKQFSHTQLNVGDSVEVVKQITRKDIEDFSRLSGDTNPIHEGLGGIVHGAYLNGLVSGVIGTKLPGPGTLVVYQTLRFPNKCYVGDEVSIQVRLKTLRKLLEVNFSCVANGRVVLEGDAKLVVEK